MLNIQTSLCSAKDLDCISSIKVDSSDCHHQCSGILVTSYEQNEIESFADKMIEFMMKDNYKFNAIGSEFQGFYLKT